MKGKKLFKVLALLLAFIIVAASPKMQMSATAAGSELPFTDVSKGRWFYDYVKYVYENEIMTGLNATTFGSEDKITRAMVVTVLYRIAGEPLIVSEEKVFPDVPTGKWYSNAVAWAKENNIVGGYNTGLFGTNDNILRQDFVKILKGFADYIGVTIDPVTTESYTIKPDAKNVSNYAKQYVEWAYQRSIIGQGSDLDPKGYLSRAEAAAMIMRFDKLMGPLVAKQGKCLMIRDETEYEDGEWTLYGDGTLYVKGEGSLELVIGIGEEFDEERIKKLILEEGITALGEDVFRDCSGLREMVLPDSLEHIARYAFWSCKKLKSLYISENIKFIAETAFAGCGNIETLTVSENNIYYDNRDNCNAIIRTEDDTLIAGFTNAIIPDSVKSIGEMAFYDNDKIEELFIPSGIENISELAFTECTGLKRITVSPDNPVFDSRENCNAIIETDTNTLRFGCINSFIPDSVEIIDKFAFFGIKELTQITIPSSVKTIDWWAFAETGLKEIVLPEGVETIYNTAFSGCDDLTSIYIPASATDIDGNPFMDCKSIKEIKVSEENPIYDSRNDCNAIIETESNALIVGCKTTIIPGDVTSLKYYAFCGCTALKKIIIPNSVTEIEAGVFSYCGLTKITIPDSVTEMGYGVFKACKNLKQINCSDELRATIDYWGPDSR